jgi:hypothetical protein
MEERRAWRGQADEVRYCSASCRRHGVTATDRQLEATILELLGTRARSATVCPSEAARLVGGGDEETWRPLMEPARRAARRLVAAGDVVIVQGGHVVDPSTAKGPIRIRRV